MFVQLHLSDPTSTTRTLGRAYSEDSRFGINPATIESMITGPDGKAVVRSNSGGLYYVEETYDQVVELIRRSTEVALTAAMDDIMFGYHPASPFPGKTTV